MTFASLKKLISGYGYAFGYMLNAGANFLLAIFLTNYLSKGDFGTFSIYKAAIFTLWPFIGFSTHYFLQVQFFKEKKEDFGTLLSSSLTLNFLLFLVLELVAVIFQTQISDLFDISVFWVMTIPLVAFLLSVVKIGLVLMQVTKNLKNFLLISSSQVLINLSLTYYLIVVSAYDWQGRSYSLIISNLVVVLIVLFLFTRLKLIKFVFSKSQLIKAAKFGLAAIMLDICIVLIAFSDKIMIKKIVSTESLGVYALALQLAAVIGVVDSAFTESLYPKIYKYLSQNEFNKVFKLSTKYLMGLAVFAWVYSLIAPRIYVYLIDSSFTESFAVMNWIIIALCLLSLYKILVSQIYYFDKAKTLVYPSLAIIVVNLILHFLLVPKLGVKGAIITNIVSYSLLSLSVFVMLQKIHKKRIIQ